MYLVKTLSLQGKGNRLFKCGDLVRPRDFSVSELQRLLANGYLEKMPKKPAHYEVSKTYWPDYIPGLTIVTGMWQRPEVFELFAAGIKSLAFNLPVIVAGSEGEASKQLAEKHGFIYVEVPNDPLACKMNATTLVAQEVQTDYVLCLGSDDVMSIWLLNAYLGYMAKGYDFVGVTDFYFYDTVSQKAAYWGGYREGYRKGVTAGPCRLLSRKFLEACQWMPWEVEHSHILDNSMQRLIDSGNFKVKTFSLKESGLYAVDIKSSTNMTPFKLWDNTEYIDADELLSHFDIKIKE